MDGLRWLLLLFGALVVAGVYFYTRAERRRLERLPADSPRVEPTLGPADAAAADVTELSASVGCDGPESKAPPGGTEAQKIVTLRLVARGKRAFAGDELILSLRGIGMRHGKFGIFHRIAGDDEDTPIFSVASLVEPGSFDLANLKEQEIPGISLFLVLPCPVDGAEAFDLMMAAARALSKSLDGELLDESGSTLSIQRERYMREEIIQFQHSNMVA